MTMLQKILNSNQLLLRHLYYLSKIPDFTFNGGLMVWKSSFVLDTTLTWFEKNLSTKAKDGQIWTDLENIVDPLGLLPGNITSVRLEKTYTSAAKPMLLTLTSQTFETSRIIFKRGDNLRQDYAVQVMFYIFNRLWQLSPMKNKPFIHQYKILTTSNRTGFLEYVSGCTSAGDISWKAVLNPVDKLKLFTSMAGSYLACWVLGIRDRHQDNMMIKDNTIFFHIDFGFIFNDAPGFDAPIFSIPGGFRKHLTNDEWAFFP